MAVTSQRWGDRVLLVSSVSRPERQMNRTDVTTKKYPAQNVNSVEVEKF